MDALERKVDVLYETILEMKKDIEELLEIMNYEEDEDEQLSPVWEGCQHHEINELGNIICPRPLVENEKYCQEHLKTYNEFLNRLTLYVEYTLGKADPEKIKIAKSESLSWMRDICEDVGGRLIDVKKFIKSLDKENKSIGEIVQCILEEF